MAEATWYWAEGEERNGPVTAAAIARLVADGKLGADDRIWKDGMPEWIPVSKVPALAKYLKKPVVGASAAAVAVDASASSAATATAVKAQAPEKAESAVKAQPASKAQPRIKVEEAVAKPAREAIPEPVGRVIYRPSPETIFKPAREVIAEPVAAAVEDEPVPVDSQNGHRAVVEVSRAEFGYRNPTNGTAPSAEAGYRNGRGEGAPKADVSSYNSTGEMPPRAGATLAKQAAPRGDVGDWPLDDVRVAQFDQALKLRKKIDSAAALFGLLLLLAAISGTVLAVSAAVMAVTASRGSFPRAEKVALITSGAVCVGVIILFCFAWKGTTRSKSWAPLTMGILFVLAALAIAAQIAMHMPGKVALNIANPELVGDAAVIFLATVFAYVAFRACLAIPKYLLQPAWCQELLSKTSG